jgi:cytochrome c553
MSCSVSRASLAAALAACGALIAGGVLVACAAQGPKAGAVDAARAAPEVPEWVFPLGAPPTTSAPASEPEVIQPIRLPNSAAQFTRAQLSDRFAAPDWYPASHGPMPEIVARGRAPDLFACGYCHTPGGQGRPENAPLAGLPSEYILQQVMDFKSGARRALLPGVFPPADAMVHEATEVTQSEAEIAARYFAGEKLRPRVIVLERSRVPRTQVVGSVYTPIASGGEEPLGTRLIELARDSAQHENRDEQMRYVAYVPPGSIARGRSLARTGNHGHTIACVTCHGDKLQGMGAIPPLAGRSPSYLLRQLLAFRTGTRTGALTQPMQPVVANLDIGNMIDAVAFAASLPPP